MRACVRQLADKTALRCTFVMATGIVSLDLHQTGWEAASLVFFGIAALAWAALALGGRLAGDLGRGVREALVARRERGALGARARLAFRPGRRRAGAAARGLAADALVDGAPSACTPR